MNNSSSPLYQQPAAPLSSGKTANPSRMQANPAEHSADYADQFIATFKRECLPLAFCIIGVVLAAGAAFLIMEPWL